MKFLIDENVGESVVRFLVENGYDIVRAKDLLPSRGVILFRFSTEIPALKISALEITLTKFSHKLLDHFTVISDDKIRIRPLITFKGSK